MLSFLINKNRAKFVLYLNRKNIIYEIKYIKANKIRINSYKI